MKHDNEAKIDRRRFCLLGASAVAALCMPAVAAAAPDAPLLKGMCGVRVVRRCAFHDLQSCWSDDPDAGPCEAFSDGQELNITPALFAAYDRGEGICRHAWRSLRPYVAALMGEEGCPPKGCSPLRGQSEAEAIVSCPDGTRPVIFAISRK